jgi:hypothetical protein
MGPADFHSAEGTDVRPHPHIGVATVTDLFDGEIHHRDSPGVSQRIGPGEVNYTLEQTYDAVAASVSRSGPPQSFVMLVNGEPTGIASLAVEDLDERPDLMPWLSVCSLSQRPVEARRPPDRSSRGRMPVCRYSHRVGRKFRSSS